MPATKKSEKQLPAVTTGSVQIDLFSQFVTNDKTGVSNTVDIWESIPKYFFSPTLTDRLRTSTGHADPFRWDYTNDGIRFTVAIQPALIQQGDGSYKAFFPGVTEELIEEALKKIMSDNRRLMRHDPKISETWVIFSLSMIRRELKARGRTRSISQIKQAIQVMARSVLTLYKEGKELWTGSILQDLVTVNRAEYLHDTHNMHTARLPLFVSQAINELEYRQFNYDRLMSCEEQLARWIYKRLINRYRQADILNSYHFMYSGLECSGFLQHGRSNDNRRKVQSALDSLVERDVLAKYDIELRREGRNIVDVKYTLRPTIAFISEQKAANKRKTDNMNRAVQAGILR